MPNVTIPLTSFTGGEWSPRLHGRVDIAKYSSACEVLENMVIYPHGGITRRMGMEYIADSKFLAIRLIPFEYNREQAYVIELGNFYMRFFRDGGQIAPGGVPYEIVTPYAVTDIWQISFCQSNDVLYLAHPNKAPMKLQRTGPDVFSLTAISFTSKPVEWTGTNYPATVTLFQSRLILAGTPGQAQTIWMSKVSDLENFTTGTAANDSLKFTLSSTQNNSIQWLVPGSKLMIGTSGGEFSLDMPTNSSLSVQVKRESNFGSAFGRTQLIGNGVVYTTRDRKKMREMAYSYEADGFISPELSLFSEHLTRNTTIKDFDFSQNPDGVLWVVMQDGTFAALTYLKSQEVQGWHRHSTSGAVISVCTIETDSGSESWFAVSRGGKTRIERMGQAFTGSNPGALECTYLDSYLTYDGSPTTTISGLTHLEGQTVSVLGDGFYLNDRVVSSGQITLERSCSKVVVGLKYESRVVPLKLEGGSPMGFSQGKRKRIESLILRLERSAGIKYKVYQKDFEVLIPSRKFGDTFGEPITLFTGDKVVRLPNTWDRSAQFEISSDTPFPFTLLMIGADVTVNE